MFFCALATFQLKSLVAAVSIQNDINGNFKILLVLLRDRVQFLNHLLDLIALKSCNHLKSSSTIFSILAVQVLRSPRAPCLAHEIT